MQLDPGSQEDPVFDERGMSRSSMMLVAVQARAEDEAQKGDMCHAT